jgi:predicted nucleotidyltransferase
METQALAAATDRIVARFHPDKIILFGSQARGTANSKSDVDLLVVMPLSGRRRKLVADMDCALSGLGFARDIAILTPEEFERDRWIPGTIARPAFLQGKVLYERAS